MDELDLLGWVEGDLPRARQQPVEQLLAREPKLRELLESMAGDRRELRAEPMDRAPEDLITRVEAQLERDLLVGLSGPANETLKIPVSRVVIRQEGVLARLGGAATMRVAAIAAMLVIAGGVGLVTVQSIMRSRPGGSMERPELVTRGDGLSRMGGADGGMGSGDAALASAGLVGENADASELLGATMTPSAPLLASIAAKAAETEQMARGDATITPERAVELLREGRLAIRVKTTSFDRSIERLASIHAQPRPTWMLMDRADEVVVAALTPPPPPPASTSGVPGDMRETLLNPGLIASADGGREGAGSELRARPMVPGLTQRERVLPQAAVYMAEVDATARALVGLRGALGAGSGQASEFVELERALPLPPAASVESILWWTRAPSGWVTRCTVPVMVETVERP